MNGITKSKSTKLLSALLAVLMIVAMLPTTAFAWSVEEGTKCTSTYGDHYGCEPTEELIECINTMTPNVIYYSVYLKQENIMVGYVGVTPKTSNLEFYIFQEFRKMGIGTDALNLLIWLWFTGQITGDREAKIEAETLSQNLASVRLLEKLGFQKEAVGLRMILSEDANYQTISLNSYVLKSDVADKM